MPFLSTKDLKVQFSCQDVIFQARGACIRVRIVVILLAVAVLSSIFGEEQMNS